MKSYHFIRSRKQDLPTMSTHHHSENDSCCLKSTAPSTCQSLDELDFERGLWSAALNGDVEQTKRLLSQGKDVNAQDSAGYTPLHYASRNGHTAVCEILLARGAGVNAATRSGQMTALHRAAYSGHVDIVQLLLRHRAKTDVLDSDGKTVLHKAAEQGHEDICKLLSTSDLTSVRDARGKYPIDYVNPQRTSLINLLKANT